MGKSHRKSDDPDKDSIESVGDDLGDTASAVATDLGDAADDVARGAEDAAEDIGDAAEAALGSEAALGQEAGTGDFNAKLGELRTLLSELARSAPSAASGTFDDLKAKATEFCEACEGKVSDATQAVVRTVKERPGQVLMAAVGAGLLTWYLLSRSQGGHQGGSRKNR